MARSRGYLAENGPRPGVSAEAGRANVFLGTRGAFGIEILCLGASRQHRVGGRRMLLTLTTRFKSGGTEAHVHERFQDAFDLFLGRIFWASLLGGSLARRGGLKLCEQRAGRCVGG